MEKLLLYIALMNKFKAEPDAELRKKDTEIQKIIDTLNVERFKLLQADETDFNNYELFLKLLNIWEEEYIKLVNTIKLNWKIRRAELLKIRDELTKPAAACKKNKDIQTRKKISNIIKNITLSAENKTRLEELRNNTALNTVEENEKIELETALTYTEDLYKLLSKNEVIAEFAVNLTDENGKKIDGKVEYVSKENGYIIKYVNEAILAHEMQHLIQAMKGQLLYYVDGGTVEYLYDVNDEVEAYKVQFLVDPNSIPGYPKNINSISEITSKFVLEIENEYKEKPYKDLPIENYNAGMTLEELSIHPMSKGLKKGLSNEEWGLYKKVRFIDFLKDDKIQKGVKNYLTFGIKIFLFIVSFVMFSCNPYKRTTGMYFNDNNALGLQLYSDRTFTLGIVYSHMASFVRNCGLYEIKKDRIILKSHNKYLNAALLLEINARKTEIDSISIIYSVWSDGGLIRYSCVPLYLSINEQGYEEKFNQRFCMKDTLYLTNKELQSLKIKTIGEKDENIYCLDVDKYNEFTIRAEFFKNEYHTIFFDSLVFERNGAALVNFNDTISIEGTSVGGRQKFIVPGKMTKRLKNPDGAIQSINRYITALKTERFRCE